MPPVSFDVVMMELALDIERHARRACWPCDMRIRVDKEASSYHHGHKPTTIRFALANKPYNHETPWAPQNDDLCATDWEFVK